MTSLLNRADKDPGDEERFIAYRQVKDVNINLSSSSDKGKLRHLEETVVKVSGSIKS